MQVRLVVFGGFEARLASGAAVNLPRKARALLGYLALRPGQPHARDKLATLLWGDRGDAQARTSLRQSLGVLRRTLVAAAPSTLLFEGKNVTLNPEAVEVDAVTFERLVAAETPAALEEAVALYAGDLLEGFDPIAAPFEEWLVAERERLRELALEALAKLLRHQSEARVPERAIQTALRLLALDPLQEPVHRTLMRLYARHGRRANALRQYQVCVEVLQRELGVEPEPETRRVYQEVLQHQAHPSSTPELSVAAPRRSRRGPPRVRPEVPTLDPPLIGRRTELAHLQQALDDAWGGSGRTVVVLGEAGIGKTRLLEEFAATTLRRSGHLVVGRCYETEQILPFGLWVEMLRAAVGVLERDVSERLDPAWRAELARLLPELADPGLPPTGPADDYLRLFGAVIRLIEMVAAEAPLVLILEDLHWADEMSVRLFGFLARRLEALPGLLVASARTEELGEAPLLRRLLEEFRGRRDVVPLTLPSLSEDETHSLVQVLARVGTHEAALGRVAKQVWALSEGNPFVAVETMRALHEGHRFGPSTIALPERVREAIGGRLERLSPRARDLLAVAAVIGREFEFTLLQRAGRLDERGAAEGVEELVRRRVLHGVGARLDFTHDRIRQVAYGQLLPGRRTLLHAAVGEAIEAVHADRLEAHHAALGMHYRQGEVWEKALKYLRQAGARALAYSANRDVVAYVDQALEVLGHLPESPSKTEQACDLRMYRAAGYYSLGELRGIADHLGEAEALAQALDDRTRLGRVAVFRSACLAPLGDQTPAIEAGERGLAIAEAAGDLPLQISATFLLGFSHIGLGDSRRAIGFMRRTAALLEGQPVYKLFGQIAPPSVYWRAWMLLPLGELGEFPEAIALGEEAVRIAEAVTQPYGLALAHGTLGHLHGLKGEPSLAIPPLERSAALCRDYELVVLSPFMFGSLGHAYATAGRAPEALPLMEEALARGASLHLMWYQSRRMTQLGEGHLLGGHVDDALAAAEHALTLADAHGERGNRAYALRLLAEATLRRGHPDVESAGQHLGQALVLAEELGMRPLAARCRLDMGRLYLRSGDRTKARDHLGVASARLREMDMRRWSEQAEAASQELG
jgi:DNA-binding SARP family transcriptional activator